MRGYYEEEEEGKWPKAQNKRAFPMSYIRKFVIFLPSSPNPINGRYPLRTK